MDFVLAQMLGKRRANCQDWDDVMIDFLCNEGEEKVDGRTLGSPRAVKPRQKYWESTWGRMLREEKDQLLIPGSDEAQCFRLRFRLPFPVYSFVLEWVRTWYCWSPSNPRGIKDLDHFGHPAVPVELKVLGVLRVLGRSTCFDGIKELSGMSISAMQTFFHLFCKKVSSELFMQWVTVPTTKEEVSKVMGPYAATGLTGTIGSADVVHVHWAMCPVGLQNLYTGKEGFPTIAYQMICDHAGRILSCTPGFYGACNDKSIIRFDGWINAIRQGMYRHVKYTLRTSETEVKEVEDPYIIVDGGYHKWRCTMTGSRDISDHWFCEWRTRMESVRKDIENVFGRVKGRFRSMKLPILIHKKQHVDNLVMTCVTLHNILHEWDGLDNWESGVEWGAVDGLFEAPDDDDINWLVPTVNGVAVPPDADYSRIGKLTFDDATQEVCLGNFTNNDVELTDLTQLIELHAESSTGFYDLQKDLVTNYKYMKLAGGIVTWLR